MRLKIFSCHHLIPQTTISTEIYQTLVSGAAQPVGNQVLTDEFGKNIAGADKFCELRHQFYIWQNLLTQYDYVGFEHYRRPFYLDALPLETLSAKFPLMLAARQNLAAERWNFQMPGNAAMQTEFEAMRNSYGEAEFEKIKKWVAGHDILYTYPIFYNVDAHFNMCHSDAADLWEEFMDDIRAAWPGDFARNYMEFPLGWSGYLNMYIMRAELFCQYMDIVFPILIDLENKYPNAPGRIWGHMSERILGAFVMQKCMEEPMLRARPMTHMLFDGRA